MLLRRFVIPSYSSPVEFFSDRLEFRRLSTKPDGFDLVLPVPPWLVVDLGIGISTRSKPWYACLGREFACFRCASFAAALLVLSVLTGHTGRNIRALGLDIGSWDGNFCSWSLSCSCCSYLFLSCLTTFVPFFLFFSLDILAEFFSPRLICFSSLLVLREGRRLPAPFPMANPSFSCIFGACVCDSTDTWRWGHSREGRVIKNSLWMQQGCGQWVEGGLWRAADTRRG